MVIGAPKAGSTSLFAYLGLHPDVANPATKELCYFSDFKKHIQRYNPLRASMNWDVYTAGFSGPAAYQRAVANASARGLGSGFSPQQRRRRRRKGRRGLQTASERHLRAAERPACDQAGKLAYEGCPFYLGETRAAARIHATFPALRCVAVLRDPWSRTISAFHDYVRVGR